MFAIYIGINVFSTCFRTTTLVQLASRTGLLATFNLIPVLASLQLSVAADMFGISLRDMALIRNTFRFGAAVEGLIHVAVYTRLGKLLLTAEQIFGIVVSRDLFRTSWMLTIPQSLGSLVLSSVVTMVCWHRYFFESVLWVQFGSVFVAAAALWKHLHVRSFEFQCYILGGICAAVVVLSGRFVVDCYYNINLRHKHWLSRVTVSKIYRADGNDLIEMRGTAAVEIHMACCWNIRPGQYVYITIPALGSRYLFQSHPFWIVSWQQDAERRSLRLNLLVKERRGFTSKLSGDEARIVWVSGPFGRSQPFGDYGTVLMFATDIGIAAHLPHLKFLKESWTQARVRTRRIVLVWRMSDLSMW